MSGSVIASWPPLIVNCKPLRRSWVTQSRRSRSATSAGTSKLRASFLRDLADGGLGTAVQAGDAEDDVGLEARRRQEDARPVGAVEEAAAVDLVQRDRLAEVFVDRLAPGDRRRQGEQQTEDGSWNGGGSQEVSLPGRGVGDVDGVSAAGSVDGGHQIATSRPQQGGKRESRWPNLATR
jgi:hypothetical protein